MAPSSLQELRNSAYPRAQEASLIREHSQHSATGSTHMNLESHAAHTCVASQEAGLLVGTLLVTNGELLVTLSRREFLLFQIPSCCSVWTVAS